MILQKEKGVNEPVLPRKRKVPAWFEVGSSSGHFPDTPKEHYRQQYFECLDLVVNCIRSRFNQPGYRTLRHLEDLIINAIKKEEYSEHFSFISDFYKDDIAPASLKVQLELLSTSFNARDHQPNIIEVGDYFKSLSPAQRTCMSEIFTLLKILMVIPATNAVSERSASAVRRIKTYLRSTMTQLRLNNLLVLHIHKEMTDNLDLTACLNDFVSGSEHRLYLESFRECILYLFIYRYMCN